MYSSFINSSSTGWASGDWFEGSVSTNLQYEEKRAGSCTEGDVYIILILYTFTSFRLECFKLLLSKIEKWIWYYIFHAGRL